MVSGQALGDRYTIERVLGRGGMATVHLAEEHKHRRKVAIKILREEFSASVGAGRFMREIGIAAQLSHPHIVPRGQPRFDALVDKMGLAPRR